MFFHVNDGFPKNKSLNGGEWVGGALSKFILDFCNFAKPLSHLHVPGTKKLHVTSARLRSVNNLCADDTDDT